MKAVDLTETVVQRRAVVYVRQSTGTQVQDNLEGHRRRYELGDLARECGFREVVTMDNDLGRSASRIRRPTEDPHGTRLDTPCAVSQE